MIECMDFAEIVTALDCRLDGTGFTERMMSGFYVGQIIAVAFDFAPPGWALCNGQVLGISKYSSLFALIGTTYGGNGETNFCVPNLAGQVAIGQGTGPNLPTYVLGEAGGCETVTLTDGEVGGHAHTLQASSQDGTSITPGIGFSLASNASSTLSVYNPGTANAALSAQSIGSGPGENQPHENRQPFLAINYIIALEGDFPSHG